jgi:hypothetical protein
MEDGTLWGKREAGRAIRDHAEQGAVRWEVQQPEMVVLDILQSRQHFPLKLTPKIKMSHYTPSPIPSHTKNISGSDSVQNKGGGHLKIKIDQRAPHRSLRFHSL